MIIYITEYDPSADSLTAAGRFHPVSVRETYTEALQAVPEALRQYVPREYYYRITAWDTQTGEKVEDIQVLNVAFAMAMGAQPEVNHKPDPSDYERGVF